MTLALLAMSHSPLLEHAELDAEVSGELEAAFAEARRFVHDFDPDVIVNFAPDHYNGFFYRLMPPFCIGYAAESIGDYGSQAGRLDVPEDLARALGRGRDRRRDRPRRVAGHAGRPRRRAADGDPLRRHHGQAVRPGLHQLGRPAVHPGAAGPAARRSASAATSPPWTRRSCSSPPAACPTTRPCRGIATATPAQRAHADGGGRPALAGGARRPPAAGHRRRPGLRRRHRRPSRTWPPSGTASCWRSSPPATSPRSTPGPRTR